MHCKRYKWYILKKNIQSIDVLMKDTKHSSITRIVKKNNILSMDVLRKYIQCINIMHGDHNLDTLSGIKHECVTEKYNTWMLLHIMHGHNNKHTLSGTMHECFTEIYITWM